MTCHHTWGGRRADGTPICIKCSASRPDAVALGIAHALAEPLTGFDLDDLPEHQQDELLGAAYAAMKSLEEAAANREPLDEMRSVEFPFADNH